MLHVGWIFSLVRSGSSAASYAAAAPWGLPVADELFGPWDRTGPPHNMPKRQAELVRAFRAVGHVLTAEIVGLAHDILRELAERDESGKGWVVCKCPHLMFTPKDFETWFGSTSSQGIVHHQAHVIRNPLRRVNSCYTRGWEHMLNDPYELGVYRTFLHRWQNAETKLRFEDMRSDPGAFFGALYEGWGLEASSGDIAKASDYLANHYHDSSASSRTIKGQFTPKSEARWGAPPEVIDAYLADDEMLSFMDEQGWSTSRSSYEGWLPTRLMRAFRGGRQGASA
ncbi:MAG: hypothetical protein Phyf2KO_16770 [Phycisphaerales bacterium]